MSNNGKAILFLLPSSAFREEEYFSARQALEQRGLKVVVASTVKNGAVGSEGNTVTPDVLISEVKPDEYAGIVLIGGHGASQYWHDVKAHQIIRAYEKDGKVIAAIDRAPVTLGVAGVLKNKRVTGHISIFEKLVNSGSKYTGKKVERDGNLLTAEGANAASAFAEALARAFAAT
ncbi:MAG: DJ-1/PfpI family protein [bacterium]